MPETSGQTATETQTENETPDQSQGQTQDEARSESGLPVEEIEAEREKRLDPENRPDEAEVDNTDREFDREKGMYTDAEGYEQAPKKFYPEGEQGA
jgi:hypothetical protein